MLSVACFVIFRFLEMINGSDYENNYGVDEVAGHR